MMVVISDGFDLSDSDHLSCPKANGRIPSLRPEMNLNLSAFVRGPLVAAGEEEG
jgi:hypothetical protein